jgi:hypothetical protein
MVETRLPATHDLAGDAPVGSVGQRVRWGRAYAWLYIVYVALGAGARLAGWWHPDATWFLQAARHVLDGSFDLYSLRGGAPIAPPLGITYSYSPLLAIIISPVVWLNDTFGWGDDIAYRLIGVPLLFGDVLAMHQLRRLVKKWRPGVDERYLFAGIAISLFLSSFLLVTAFKGHVEGLLLLFLVLTLRFLPRNLLLGSLFAGLALATKHTSAILALVPVGLVLLAGGRHVGREEGSQGGAAARRRWPELLRLGLRDALVFSGISLGVLVLFMLPALLRNSDAVFYTFFTLPQNLIIFGPGLPGWLDWVLHTTVSPTDYPVAHQTLVANANYVLLLAATLVPAVVIWRAHRAGKPIGLLDVRLVGLVAVNLALSIVLSKWVSDHYYALPLACIFLWDILRSSSPVAGGRARSLVPWVGLGSAIAYRTITQINIGTAPLVPFQPPWQLEFPVSANMAQFTLGWFSPLLLFVLFTGLSFAILRWVLGQTDRRRQLNKIATDDEVEQAEL